MNDTVEFRWPTKGVEEPGRLAARYRKKLSSLADEEISREKRDSLDAHFGLTGLSDQLIEIDSDIFARKRSEEVNLRHEEKAEETFQRLNRNYGILSLSETPRDVRMWGHYADGGRGFLVEFDSQHSWFHAMRNPDDGINELMKVNYISSRVRNYLLDLKDEVLYSKWEVWQDEQEWRIIRSFNDAAKKLDEPDSCGNYKHLFSIPPDSIMSVVFGFSVDAKLEESVRNIIQRNPDLTHVNLKRAMQSFETGQVEIVQES
jgi:hypothetical protein